MVGMRAGIGIGVGVGVDWGEVRLGRVGATVKCSPCTAILPNTCSTLSLVYKVGWGWALMLRLALGWGLG